MAVVNSKFTLRPTLEQIFETCATFRSASTALDHAFVVACGLTHPDAPMRDQDL